MEQDTLNIGKNFSIRNRNLSEEIADSLEAMIIEEQLAPGSRFPTERKLAEKFKVNRNTVREGIMLLKQRGLVDMKVGSGTYVKHVEDCFLVDVVQRFFVHKNISSHDVMELRMIISPGAATNAARNATMHDLEELLNSIECMKDAFSKKDKQGYVKADIKFHQIIFQATGNQLLEAFMVSISKLLELWMTKSSANDWTDSGVIEHEEIYEAIFARDPVLAYESTKNHLESGLARMGILDTSGQDMIMAQGLTG